MEHHLEIGSGDVVVIDKLYGPTGCGDLRISIDLSNNAWVIERHNFKTNTWHEEARVDCQRAEEYE